MCSEILSSRAFGELSALSASLRSYEVFISKGRIVKRDKGCANEGKRRQSNLMMYKCVIFILFYFIRAPRDDKGGTYSSIFPSSARHFRHFSPLKHHVLEQTYRKRAEKVSNNTKRPFSQSKLSTHNRNGKGPKFAWIINNANLRI